MYYYLYVFTKMTVIKKCMLFKLCTDIEKNPGPRYYVDPSKTIKAPYSQGNIAVFNDNAGAQCTAMSLCSLVYNDTRGITSKTIKS